MKNQRRLVAIVACFGVLAAGAGVYISKHAQPNGATAQANSYYCPMHPSYTSPKPGNCPICNMALVKRESEPGAGAAEKKAHDDTDLHSICYLHNCPMHRDGKPCPMIVLAKPGEKVTCPICGTHVAKETGEPKERKILYWTDPMIPGFRAEGPGKSPMGMDLVPVYEEEEPVSGVSAASPDGYAPIMLTPQKQQLIGVTAAPVERKQVTKIIRAVGTIAHDPELYQAQAEYIQAMRTLKDAEAAGNESAASQAKRMADSTRIRLKHLGLSDDLIDEIETWKEPEHSLLFSQPGDPVWMYAQVYEYELPYVKVGLSVEVEAPSAQGKTFKGVIRAIDQMVEPSTRTTRIRAQLEDPEGFLRPDMYVNALINVDLGEVVAVPSSAVFDTGAKRVVFIQREQGLFEPREVTLGASGDGFYEVRSGLDPGEVVVTSGNFLMDSESRLKAAVQGAGGGGHQHE